MSAADKIAEAKAALEELANMPLGISLADWSRLSSPILEALREQAQTDLADAQAQEIARLREALGYVTSDLFYQIEAKHGPKAASGYPSISNARAALADAQAQEIARLKATVTVDVKPLEWRDLTYGMRPHWTANHPFGSIDIRQEDEDLEWRWVVRPFIGGRSNWPTLEEAKADAEADYRARVRAALGDAP